RTARRRGRTPAPRTCPIASAMSPRPPVRTGGARGGSPSHRWTRRLRRRPRTRPPAGSVRGWGGPWRRAARYWPLRYEGGPPRRTSRRAAHRPHDGRPVFLLDPFASPVGERAISRGTTPAVVAEHWFELETACLEGLALFHFGPEQR